MRRWINSEVVSDIDSGKVLSRRGYWYDGPVDSCDPATIIAAIGLALTAGTTAYSFATKPEGPKPPKVDPTQVAADAAKTKQNQLAALSQQIPGLQEKTGGSLSPEALEKLSELLSGQAGQPGIGSAGGDLISRLLGKSGGGSSVPFSVAAGNATGEGTGTTGLALGR